MRRLLEKRGATIPSPQRGEGDVPDQRIAAFFGEVGFPMKAIMKVWLSLVKPLSLG
jgi:hypothetical protein